MGWLSKKKKEPEISEEKKALLKEGKELGLNLDANMSEYELRHRIDEEKAKQKPKPQPQPSKRRGEY